MRTRCCAELQATADRYAECEQGHIQLASCLKRRECHRLVPGAGRKEEKQARLLARGKGDARHTSNCLFGPISGRAFMLERSRQYPPRACDREIDAASGEGSTQGQSARCSIVWAK